MNVTEIGEIETDLETPSRKRKQNKGKARKWNEEKTDVLTDLLEQYACLWM